MKERIDICVRLDAKSFRRYCAFNAFYRQHLWYWPLLASMILFTLSLAGLIGWLPISASVCGILTGLGFAIPMVLFGIYYIQIEVQIATHDLKSSPEVYALSFDDTCLTVTNRQKQEAPVRIPWDVLWAAYRYRNSIYIYVNPGRALIIPENQSGTAPDALWGLIRRHMRADRCFERPRKRGKGAH